ncbi:hypothetical protein BV25DRAFT_1841610 [Artomyces pyxidatus]|uniref:Uncharacterized protein n=1 Tax=Artomyces pyxidatus TaxID=48021 RepID=A0ACB8SLP9_9AGAM|nr:hypothetical protein BV25DRAFT_1841610 [Artomyces pyxidatus]
MPSSSRVAFTPRDRTLLALLAIQIKWSHQSKLIGVGTICEQVSTDASSFGQPIEPGWIKPLVKRELFHMQNEQLLAYAARQDSVALTKATRASFYTIDDCRDIPTYPQTVPKQRDLGALPFITKRKRAYEYETYQVSSSWATASTEQRGRMAIWAAPECQINCIGMKQDAALVVWTRNIQDARSSLIGGANDTPFPDARTGADAGSFAARTNAIRGSPSS